MVPLLVVDPELNFMIGFVVNPLEYERFVTDWYTVLDGSFSIPTYPIETDDEEEEYNLQVLVGVSYV